MLPLYTESDYTQAKSRDLLPMKCERCGDKFVLLKYLITKAVNGKSPNGAKFCSIACANKAKHAEPTTPIITNCSTCGIDITGSRRRIKRSKSGRLFCSKSCAGAATLNRIGYKKPQQSQATKLSLGCRSKLEFWMEHRLLHMYRGFTFLFNTRSTIKLELDIYIVELQLAFELSGTVHYAPIFGEEAFKKILANDASKQAQCQDAGIELHVIDTRSQINFNTTTSLPFWQHVQSIISEAAKRKGLDYQCSIEELPPFKLPTTPVLPDVPTTSKRQNPVVQLCATTGKFLRAYPSVKEASQVTKVPTRIIHASFHRAASHGGGYTWKLLTGDEYATLVDIDGGEVAFKAYVHEKAVIVTKANFKKVYPRITDAANELGLSTSLIGKVLRGVRNHTGGYHFQYV